MDPAGPTRTMPSAGLTHITTVDEFDSVLFLEEKFQKDGFLKGLQAGHDAGYTEGEKLGIVKGSQIGGEVGFYHACVAFWESALQHESKSHALDPDVAQGAAPPSDTSAGKSARVLRSLDQLSRLLQGFSMDDPNDEQLFDSLERIRSKFKLICSQLGTPQKFEQNAFDFLLDERAHSGAVSHDSHHHQPHTSAASHGW